MKGSDHKAITSKAIEIICANSPSSLATKIADHHRAISNASQDEDTSPIFTRLTNWHFYKANKYLQPRHYSAGRLHTPIPINPTSEIIYSHWVKQLGIAKKAAHNDEFCDALGRILHHVQDMSTPSHVVPVYHDLSVKDSYEDWLHERRNALLAGIIFSSSEIESLINSATTDYYKIYGDAATSTLELLACEFSLICNGVNIKNKWSLFWESFSPQSATVDTNDEKYGFGSFGPLGDFFGNVGPVNRQGMTYQIEQRVYDELLETLLKKAMKDSIQVLWTAYA